MVGQILEPGLSVTTRTETSKSKNNRITVPRALGVFGKPLSYEATRNHLLRVQIYRQVLSIFVWIFVSCILHHSFFTRTFLPHLRQDASRPSGFVFSLGFCSADLPVVSRWSSLWVLGLLQFFRGMNNQKTLKNRCLRPFCHKLLAPLEAFLPQQQHWRLERGHLGCRGAASEVEEDQDTSLGENLQWRTFVGSCCFYWDLKYGVDSDG